jgi:hypothetical protein
MKKKIIPGRRYNRIVVKEKIKNRMWACVCDCGETLFVSTNQLGRIVHCQKRNRLNDKEYHEITIKRFLHKVDNKNACWTWKGNVSKHGYGVSSYRSKSTLAHRLSWILFRGNLPKDLDVCHHCDNPKCVNPEHLFLGTAKDNVMDCFNKKRKSHKGENHPRAKIKEQDVKEIFQLRKNGWTHQKLADRFKLTQSAVSNILHRRLWKHIDVGEIWQDLANGSSEAQTN